MTPSKPNFHQSLPHTACGVCGHVLNHYSGPLGDRWIHTLETDDDHIPVPVPVESINTTIMCDFCLTPNARWALPVEDYEASEHDSNVGDWAACDECAEFLRNNDWDGVTTRAMQAMRTRRGAIPSRRVFNEMYGQLRKHVTGPVRLAEITNS